MHQPESPWFERINFVVTLFTSYFNDESRPKNVMSRECEEHFRPKETQSATDVDVDIDALNISDFGALFAICVFMILLSLLSLCVEIVHSKNHRCRILQSNTSVVPLLKTFTFTYQAKYSDPESPMKEFCRLHNLLVYEHGLTIACFESKTVPCDNMFEISFVLQCQLQLNQPEILTKIANYFDVLSANLDSMSQK